MRVCTRTSFSEKRREEQAPELIHEKTVLIEQEGLVVSVTHMAFYVDLPCALPLLDSSALHFSIYFRFIC